MKESLPLWRPTVERVEAAGITRYLRWLKAERGMEFADYEALWQWSVTDLEGFWASIRDFGGMRLHSPAQVVIGERRMPGSDWFPGATVNYAEQSLAPLHDPACVTKPAIVFESELVGRTEVSWLQLSGEVGALGDALRSLGVRPGDRCAAYLPNIPQAVVAALATASVGAVWSSASPEMGPVSVLDRFRQIAPKVLFAVDGYRYGGKDFDRRAVVLELLEQLPSVEALVFVPYLDAAATLDWTGAGRGKALPEVSAHGGKGASAAAEGSADARKGASAQAEGTVDAATGTSAGGKFARAELRVLRYGDVVASPAEPRFTPVPFSHPLWIVYSSGTTGMPKPIVHGHGGTVIEALKGNMLHMDLDTEDRFFWFSTTNWIMWNFGLSTLMSGVTLVQFDGNPGFPDARTLWRLAAREKLTFMGISPAFIGLCMKAGLKPREEFDLSALRTIGSTGSPLTGEAYHWLYENVGDDLLIASISGGTDPGTAFLTACPILPIYAGEMQCRCLGSSVQAWSDEGEPLIGQVGELVCTEPMPSMPLRFWGDDDGRRYYESYFDTYPGPRPVWRHGDWLELIERPGSVTGVIYGRSDSTINRYGIRMGTSELYRVVEEFDEVADSLVIDLEYLGRPSFLALFVVLREPGSTGAGPGSKGPANDGRTAASSDTGVPKALRERLLSALRTKLSARHVPDEVYAIPEVPRTMSGKKLEVPVKKILLGQPAEKAVNRDSMANPHSIDWFLEFASAR